MKILGITDEVLECECCGKRGLKRTVVLELDDLRIVHYGTDCAGMTLYGRKTKSNTDRTLREAQAVALAQRWLAAGHSPEVVATGIWNRYGYFTAARGNAVHIGGFAIITLPSGE